MGSYFVFRTLNALFTGTQTLNTRENVYFNFTRFNSVSIKTRTFA